MQQHSYAHSPRSSPTQSRARRPVARPADGLDPAAAHDLRAPAPDAAHTREPVLIREPTLLESLSRNLRTLLPASMSPPAPRRRPLSSGSPPPMEPPAPEGERILWAAWDELDGARVLLLAYPTGLQLWDTSDLGAVRELLNLRTESLCSAGPVLAAAVLPGATPPALAVLTPTNLTVYALTTHSVVNQVPFSSPCALAARPAFIVVATTHPPTLHVLSSSTLAPLHAVLLSASPVFAASNRLLAYATTAHAPGSPTPSFLAASTSPTRALWNAVEDRAWGAAAAGVRFSRSAPAASGRWPSSPTHSPPAHPAPWIAVLDLSATPPRQTAHFAPFSPDHAGIAHLAFASVKGAGPPLLCAAPRGGQGVAVFELRGAAIPWHRYALRRGVTSARVEDVACAEGGRWVSVVTARRTVHVFATNREGGAPDVRAHLDGRAINSPEPRPLSTELAPLVRLHLPPDPDPNPDTVADLLADDPPAPLALAFLSPSFTGTLPPALRPATSRGVQDLLLFDPARGLLALRRLLLDADAEGELTARESVVATWGLQRARSWPDVFSDLPAPAPAPAQPKSKNHFLAHAELSTHAAAPALYLAHQFSFHALGEDYAPLLADGALARAPSTPLAVRRAVEVRGGAAAGAGAGEGEEFVQARAGFAEPLASAIGAHLERRAGAVLPMLPNGQRAAARGALPVRAAAEGLGRIRREIGRVRSPARRRARGVPLAFEFDEADEALFAEKAGGGGGGGGEEEEWDDGAGRAVAEVEMFDEISPAGFMDEERAGGRRGEAEDADAEAVGVGMGVVPQGNGEARARGKRRR